MTIYVRPASLDAGLNDTTNNVSALHLCSGNPATRAQVISQSLATAVFGAAEVSLSNGPVDGRMNTYAAKADMDITGNGTAQTACLISATDLLEETNLATSQLLTQGGKVSSQAWSRRFRAATAV